MQKEQFSIGELTVDNIVGGGVNPLSRRNIYLDATNGSDGNDGKKIDRAKKTLADARLQIDTNRSDQIVIVQGTSALNLAADPLITENLTYFVGNAPGGMLNHRSRIGMTSDYASPMITVSGYGNLFANLYSMHGFGSTKVSLQGWVISGNRNVFRRVHFGGPMNAVLSADAANREVVITGEETHFDHCVFGVDTIDRTGANSLVSLGAGTDTTFEDCIFLTRISGTTPYFVEVLNTSGQTRAFFNRCTFVNQSTNMAVTMAEAFKFTGGSTSFMVFDSLCTFIKVTAICAAGSYGYVWVPAGAATDKLKSVILS